MVTAIIVLGAMTVQLVALALLAKGTDHKLDLMCEGNRKRFDTLAVKLDMIYAESIAEPVVLKREPAEEPKQPKVARMSGLRASLAQESIADQVTKND